jgi:hypothetical protein
MKNSKTLRENADFGLQKEAQHELKSKRTYLLKE